MMKGKRPLMGVGHSSRPSCLKVLWAASFPFLIALLVALSVFRAKRDVASAPVVKRSRGVLESFELPGCADGRNCGSLPTLPAAEAAGSTSGREHAVGSASGNRHAAAEGSAAEGTGLEPLFLFIGVLSGRGYRHRRLAVREAWANRAQVPGLVVSKFILSEDERTPQVQKELEMYDDIVFVKEKTNYKSILYKTFYVLEYGVRHYDVKFILKTDDDAFINVQPLIQQLTQLCESPDCVNERVYLGKMAKHSEVLLQPGHKWNNAVFHNHTGLKVYPNYMMGGGYVMSGEVCRVLVDMHARMPLKFTPIEDATLGFWLMSMDLRHIDHQRFYTWAAPCCFKAPVRKQGQRIVTRFQLMDEFESDLCSVDPWLILHKIDSPTKMRYVGAKVANCSYDQFDDLIAPSIQAFVPPEKLAEWRLRHPNTPLPEPRTAKPAEGAAVAGAGQGELAEAGQGATATEGAADAAAGNAASDPSVTAAAESVAGTAGALAAAATGQLAQQTDAETEAKADGAAAAAQELPSDDGSSIAGGTADSAAAADAVLSANAVVGTATA